MQSRVGSIRDPMPGTSAAPILSPHSLLASAAFRTTIPSPLEKHNLAKNPLKTNGPHTHVEGHPRCSSIGRHGYVSDTDRASTSIHVAAATASIPTISDDAAWANLASWINKGGGDANDLSMRYFDVGGGFKIRGLASEKRVEPGEILLTVPLSMVISDVALASCPQPYSGAPWAPLERCQGCLWKLKAVGTSR
eukprot:gene7556-706_t